MGSLTGPDLALTGVPRGGTTLCCHLLQACEQTVALFEPMDVMALDASDPDQAVAGIRQFFARVRERALRDGTAPSKHVGGTVPDNPFSDRTGADGRRLALAEPGRIVLDPRPSDGFTLVVKHNAAFTSLLPTLSSALRTIAIVRHPLSVLASWNSVDLPVSSGRIPAGERFDHALAARLDAEPDRLQRQLIVLEWFYSRFDRNLSADDVLRYEDIVSSAGALLRRRAGVSGDDAIGLVEQNANPAYRREDIAQLADALRARAGSWQRWYEAGSIDQLAGRLLHAREAPPCP